GAVGVPDRPPVLPRGADPAGAAQHRPARGGGCGGGRVPRPAGVVLAATARRGDGGPGDAVHRRARRDGVRGAAGPAAHPVDGAGRGVFRRLGRDDRHQQVRAGLRGAGGADLVGLRRGAAVDHRRLLLRPACRSHVTLQRTPAEHEPVARVLPMLEVPHLDREFDYLVSAEQSDDAQPGVRVRVRFRGRLVDAFILERRSETDHTGKLGWLDRVISAEPVLTGQVRRLVDAVAARYAGTRADVIRLAVPPRHARVEREPVPDLPVMTVEPPDESGWAAYGRGAQFLAALRDGRAARAVWQGVPGERWVDRLAEAALVTVRAGRGVLAIVPDQRDVDDLHGALADRLDTGRVVALSAGLGPAERYRRWLAVLRGQA